MARKGSKKAEEWLNEVTAECAPQLKQTPEAALSTGDCRQCKELSSLGGSWTSILENLQNQVGQSPEQPGLAWIQQELLKTS